MRCPGARAGVVLVPLGVDKEGASCVAEALLDVRFTPAFWKARRTLTSARGVRNDAGLVVAAAGALAADDVEPGDAAWSSSMLEEDVHAVELARERLPMAAMPALASSSPASATICTAAGTRDGTVRPGCVASRYGTGEHLGRERIRVTFDGGQFASARGTRELLA